jgi:hemerythrin-like domain-containing protein
MKRHPHLQPLSRQHHNGLLMVLLLKKGIAKNASISEMNHFISLNWEEELKHHFEMEETILLPALAGSSFDMSLITQLKEEHSSIRAIVKKSELKTATLDDIIIFHSLLESHIRFEEKQFFPQAETVLTEAQLQKIGVQLDEDLTKNCLQYPVKFWE